MCMCMLRVDGLTEEAPDRQAVDFRIVVENEGLAYGNLDGRNQRSQW